MLLNGVMIDVVPEFLALIPNVLKKNLSFDATYLIFIFFKSIKVIIVTSLWET